MPLYGSARRYQKCFDISEMLRFTFGIYTISSRSTGAILEEIIYDLRCVQGSLLSAVHHKNSATHLKMPRRRPDANRCLLLRLLILARNKMHDGARAENAVKYSQQIPP